MNERRLKIGIVVVIILVSIYDLYLYGSGRVTISAVIWDWNKDMPIVPFLGGLVAGHLWWK